MLVTTWEGGMLVNAIVVGPLRMNDAHLHHYGKERRAHPSRRELTEVTLPKALQTWSLPCLEDLAVKC